MFQRERLNAEQIKVLKERHPDANKTKFFERVSKVIISANTDYGIVRRLQELDVHADVIFTKSR
jgi:hypothetical protein